ADQDVSAIGFGIFDDHVEIAIVLEDACIDEFILEILKSPARILLDQILVREARLGIFVDHLHIAVSRRAVYIELIFLDILAMIALRAGQAEHALLENRIVPIAQRQREAHILGAVADSSQTVLVPAIGAAAGVVVREIRPGAAILAVVFAHGSPGAFA